MNFEDAVFTEDLRISSGEKALDNLFNKDEENILNYIFLLEIDKQFVVQMS